MPPKLKLSVLLLFCGYSLFSQTQAYHIETNAGAGFRFSADSVSPFHVNYLVLRELAREHLVEVHDVKLRFEVRITADVLMDGEGRTCVSLKFREAGVSGHTSYRDFDLSPLLVPSSCKIDLTHADRTDPSLSRTYSLKSVFDNGITSDVPQVPLSQFNPATDTLIIKVSMPEFDQQDLDRLSERINLINDYYASATLLDTILVKGGAVRTDSVPLMPFSLADIMEISGVTELIMARGFDTTLLDGGPDPRNLKTMRREAFRMSKTLAYNFLDQLDRVDSIVPAAGVDSMALYFVDGMIRFIRLSTLMSESSGNIYTDYLDRYFSLVPFPDETGTVLTLLEKIWPGAKPDTLMAFVSGKIYDAYKVRARQLISQNRYAEAVTLVRQARLFRQKDPWLNGVNGTEELLAEAAKGVYTSYLGIAASSISYEKFAMAEVYLMKALDYRRNNEAWFATDTLYGSIFMRLFRMRLQHCDRLFAQGAFSDAISCYQTFESRFEPELVAMVSPWIAARTDSAWRLLFSQQEKQVGYYLKEELYDSLFLVYDNLGVTLRYLRNDTSESRRYREIRTVVLPVKYDIFSGKAFRAIEVRNYSDAWVYWLAADSVASEMGKAHDSAFCALQRDVFRYHQVEEISYRTGYIWSDQFDSAWYYLGRVKERIESYGLSDDPVLSAAVAQYEIKIFQKQCMNRAEEAEILVLRASRNAEMGRYADAYKQYTMAGDIAAASPECKLSFPAVRDSVSKYRAPAVYQSGEDTLQFYYVIGNYGRVFGLIAEMQERYRSQGLNRFRLEPVTLHGYLAEKNDPSMTSSAVEMMVVNGKPDEALSYLALLRSQGRDPGQTARLQETIGLMLAQRDIATGVTGNYKQNLVSYTGNDKWYKVLEKAYCSAF